MEQEKENKEKTLFANFGYMEPEMIFIEIAAMVFEIDIELFIFDGVLDGENRLEDFNFGNLNFKGRSMEKEMDDSIEKIPGKIKLIYNLETYSMFYDYEDILNSQEILDQYISDKDFINISIMDFDECLKCKENSSKNNKKILFHDKKIFCCYDCLHENSKFYLKERLNMYLKDGCLSRECMIINIFCFFFFFIYFNFRLL